MNSLIRIFAIGITALAVGLLYNLFHSRGIHRDLLLPSSLLQQEQNVERIQVISADSAFVLLQSVSVGFLDVREENDYALDHIPGAYPLPFSDIIAGNRKPFLDEKREWIMYDQSGNMKKMQLCASYLLEEDIRKIYLLFGGYFAWLDANYSVVKGDSF